MDLSNQQECRIQKLTSILGKLDSEDLWQIMEFISRWIKKLIILILYVDDLLIVSNQINVIQQVKAELCAEFEMTDLGEARHFLGIQLEQNLEERTI